MLALMRLTVCTGDAGGGRSVCTGEEEHKVCIICLHCLYYMSALVKKNTNLHYMFALFALVMQVVGEVRA